MFNFFLLRYEKKVEKAFSEKKKKLGSWYFLYVYERFHNYTDISKYLFVLKTIKSVLLLIYFWMISRMIALRHKVFESFYLLFNDVSVKRIEILRIFSSSILNLCDLKSFNNRCLRGR